MQATIVNAVPARKAASCSIVINIEDGGAGAIMGYLVKDIVCD